MNFEKKIERLKKIEIEMQKGNLTYKKNVDYFKEANKLIKECTEELDKAHLELEIVDKEKSKH